MRIALCAARAPTNSSLEREHWLDLIHRLAGRHPEIQLTRIQTPAGLSKGEGGGETVRTGREDGAWARLLFEQFDLPRAALEAGADLLFIPHASSPLRSSIPVIAAGRGAVEADGSGVVERIRRSLGQAGLRGAAAALVFGDEPAPMGRGIPYRSVPPSVSPGFRPGPAPDDLVIRSRLGLPETYVLCLAPPEDGLDFLLAAWTWVDGSVGDSIPLVAAGVPSSGRDSLRSRARDLDVAASVHEVGDLQLSDLPSLIRGAQAYLDAGGSWPQALRWALACGVPAAAVETETSAAVLGDSAYLVTAEDSRALGAACLTLLVEPEVADPLRQKGLARAEAFHGEGPVEALYEVLVRAARRGPATERPGGER